MRPFIYYCLFVIGLYGCSIQKPIYQSSSLVKNNTTSLSNPQLSKMPTFFKPLVIGGLWFTGATLLGTQMEMEENTSTGTIKRPVTEGEAMGFGAIFGALATAYSINDVVKERRQGGKIIELDSDSKKQKWFSKYNRQNSNNYVNYYFIGNDIYLTTPKTLTEYRFQDVQDVRLYQMLYPNQPAEGAIERTLTNASVPEEVLVEILSQLKPNPTQEKDLKRRYTLAAADLNTFLVRQDTYNILKTSEIPGQAAKRVKAFEQLELYRKRIGSSTSFDDQIIDNIYKNCSIQQLDKLIDWYPDYSRYRDLVKQYITSIYNISDLKATLSRFGPTFKNEVESRAVQQVLSTPTSISLFAYHFPSSKYLLAKNNTLFVGKTPNAGGIASGEGIMYDKSDGSYWQGTFVGGVLNGPNCKVQASKYSYEGGYLMGKKSGKGALNYYNKYTYSGDFYNDEMHGSGSFSGGLSEISLVSMSGNYTGKMANGYAHGYGKLSFENGEAWYEGGFVDGRFEGNGTIRYPNGVRFTGPWKNHSPNGKFHVYKYTLMGLIREDYYQEMYSFDDMGKGEGALIDKWNNARADDRRRDREKEQEEEAKEKAREKAEEAKEKAESEEKKVKECMSEVNSALKELRSVDEGWFTNLDCPCMYYEDPSFFGYRLSLKVNDKNEWIYILHGFWSDKESEKFYSKDGALRGVCEHWYKSKK
ncbi:hypothetical protein FHS57_006039 [Runella defluvii]|uniref:MORN repeat-containing protein n=1 Tax=Runella defluvii TaxID=370973 RepID=A0A7W6ETM3_9BACT|nr:hypothetical protein [Runella defluvii]MBB3842010.1 hypothetical protein [Runella defluvii]